jgi:hypothetical protein
MRKQEQKVPPWTTVPAADFQAKIDLALVKKRSIKPASGTVLVPRRHVSVRDALLDVFGSHRLRTEAEEVLECKPLEDIFRPFLDREPRWLVRCSVTDSMVTGIWGLKYFRLGRRGYIYHEPDWGTGEDDDSLSILGAWEPIEDAQAFRACFLNAYTTTWNEFGFPPCMGQWAQGPSNIMLEAVCAVLQRDSSGWPAILDRIQKDKGSGQAEFDQLIEETARRTELEPLIVSGILRPFLESAGTKSLIHLRKLSEREIRVIVGSFLILIARGGF